MKLETRNSKLVFQVRPATLADIPALLALERGAPTAAHWAEADYHRFLAEVTGHVVLVIEEDAIQGFIVGRECGPEWELENVVVAASARRRGLGAQLVRELLNRARDRGAEVVFLEVRESNRAARTLYSRSGFVENGRRKSYYGEPEEDAVLYNKLFPQPLRKAVEGGGGV